MITPFEAPLLPRPEPFRLDMPLADIEFGTLSRDGNCVGIGICRMKPATRPSTSSRRCHLASARLSAGLYGALRLFFPFDALRPCTERAFFRSFLFPVPVACVVPEVLVRATPGLQQHIIAPGAYPIRRTETGYWIEF